MPTFVLLIGMLLGLSAWATEVGWLEPEPELRLRLKDQAQEIRTTSVNWIDLLPKETRILAKSGLTSPGNHEPNPLAPRIFIDAGHGGSDLGAVGPSALLEKHLVLKLAQQVRQDLIRLSESADFPVEVRMSREGDQFVARSDRVKMAREWGADVFVSIHANSSEVSRVQGFEVYFLSSKPTDLEAARVAVVENAGETTHVKKDVLSILSDVKLNLHINQSSRFAEKVYEEMSNQLRPNKRGVRQAPFTVLMGTEMPSILVEVGYITHPQEAQKLRRVRYLKRVASAISSGVMNFLMGRKGLS